MNPGKLDKLRAMSVREVGHRLTYGARTALERRAHRRGRLAHPDRLQSALRPAAARGDWRSRLLDRSQAGRFFVWEDDPRQLRDIFRARYAGELVAAREVADRVARHQLSFFGETFQFGATIDWHADPSTRAQWPRTYHRDVPVHGGNVGFGDVKHVWELNRHQFLVDLAKVAFLDQSEHHAAALFRLLDSWQTAVPYGTGAPWACALEPAFRAWSWMWSYSLVRCAHSLPEDVHLKWLAGFFDHGRFLHRHLELYSSPYNHLIGEASALFALGVLFPEFRESASWVRRGREVMEGRLGEQFHADGGTVEQSTFYHHATLGFYLLSAVLADRNGIPLSPAIRQAIERGIEFSMAMAQPDGRVPSIGGADDGKAIRLEHAPFWDFRAYQAMGAVLFARSDFKAAAGTFQEDALWVLGTAGAESFDRLEAHASPPSRALEASGYYVFRTDWSREADYVCFDCGEQAAGLRRDSVPSAAHGHADCLSVIVTLGGEPVLVDPGFFCYNGDPEWEVHFRKTLAHNTLTVDGRDQARHLSKMNWTHTYHAQPGGSSTSGDVAWVRGSHDGYADGPHGVRHQRTVWLRPDGCVVLFDEIIGNGPHVVRVNYQFAPGALVANGGNAVLFGDRFEMAWACTDDATVTVSSGEPRADGGWVARSLGVREPAPRLVLEFQFGAPRMALMTVLADRNRVPGSNARIHDVMRDGRALSARVAGPEGDDWLIASNGQPVRSNGIETDAAMGAVRFKGNEIVAASRIGGSYLRPTDAPTPGEAN